MQFQVKNHGMLPFFRKALVVSMVLVGDGGQRGSTRSRNCAVLPITVIAAISPALVISDSGQLLAPNADAHNCLPSGERIRQTECILNIKI